MVLSSPRSARAAYSTPFWTQGSTSQESAIAAQAALAMSPEGVDVRTGELFWTQPLFSSPGRVDDNVFALNWRSMRSGVTQFGRGWLANWEITVEQIVVNSGSPNSNGGHYVNVRRPSGRIDVYDWNGAAYSAQATDVYDALSLDGSGNYLLSDRWGGTWSFSASGLPATWTDRNGNVDTFTYNGSKQITGITDDRNKSYTFQRDASGRVTSFTDPASRTWSFTYDSADNLTSVTTPSTPDQSSGITTTYGYDSSNRMTSVTDGRGNAVWAFTWITGTSAIDKVTIDGDDVDYSYATGRTDRTDRNGNVHRTHFTGNQVTQRDMLVGTVAKYATEYRYTGDLLTTVVYPRGNRVDFTYDSAGNITERRHRTADTATNSSTDRVFSWTYTTGNLEASFTDPRGSTWTYTRDSSGNLTAVSNPTITNPATQTSSRTFYYNSYGQLTSTTDEESRVRAYTYFASGANVGLLEQVEVDPSGLDLTTTFTYDAAGNVSTVTDPRGKVWSMTFDNLRRLTQTQAPTPLSFKVKFGYDGNGNLVKKEVENRDKDGSLVSANPWFKTEWTYTPTDRVATLVEEIDASTTRTTTFTYDTGDNLIRVTKPEGNKIKFEYDERDLLIHEIRGETSSIASTWDYGYDDNGNRVTIEDARGNTTTYTLDLFDRVTKIEPPLGARTELELDKGGYVTKVERIDSSNTVLQRSSRYYDERGRLWKTSDLHKDPSATYSDAVTTVTRLKTGEVASITNPRGKVTSNTYDAAGRRTKVTDALGGELAWTYDANGNATAWSILEKDGTTDVVQEFEATYDEANRRTSKAEIDQTNSSNRRTTTYGLDSRGCLVWMVNAEGNPTRWTFDGLSRMTKVERALTVGSSIETFLTAKVDEYTFDKNDRLVTYKDDSGDNTTTAYDAQDRRTTVTLPDSTTHAWAYDANGNATSYTDPAGNVVADTLDAANQMTSRAVTRATGFLDTTYETWSYDALGRVTTAEDNDYRVDYTYGVLGLSSTVYTETGLFPTGTPHSRTVTSKFDACGNRTYLQLPNTKQLSYTFDDIDEMTVVTESGSAIKTYTKVGRRLKSAANGNGTTQTNTYGGYYNEPSAIVHANGGTSFLTLNYAYNKQGHLTYERYGASGSAGDAFGYDKLERLTNAWMGSMNPASPQSGNYSSKIDYALDDDGNRSNIVVTPWAQTPVSTSYSPNSRNRYTTIGGVTVTNDANGNVTADGTYTYAYNYKNLLIEVRQASNSQLVKSYQYDAFGRLVLTTNYASTQRRFVYSGGDIVATYDGSGSLVASSPPGDTSPLTNGGPGGGAGAGFGGAAGAGLPGMSVPIYYESRDITDCDNDGNTTEWIKAYYHTNALGSVMELTGPGGCALAHYRWSPSGAPTITNASGTPVSSDPIGQPFGCCGRLRHDDTELVIDQGCAYSTTASCVLNPAASPGCVGCSGGPALPPPKRRSPVPPAVGGATSPALPPLAPTPLPPSAQPFSPGLTPSAPPGWFPAPPASNYPLPDAVEVKPRHEPLPVDLPWRLPETVGGLLRKKSTPDGLSPVEPSVGRELTDADREKELLDRLKEFGAPVAKLLGEGAKGEWRRAPLAERIGMGLVGGALCGTALLFGGEDFDVEASKTISIDGTRVKLKGRVGLGGSLGDGGELPELNEVRGGAEVTVPLLGGKLRVGVDGKVPVEGGHPGRPSVRLRVGLSWDF